MPDHGIVFVIIVELDGEGDLPARPLRGAAGRVATFEFSHYKRVVTFDVVVEIIFIAERQREICWLQ